MTNNIKDVTPIVNKVVIGAFIVGVILGVLGIVLVVLGATGNTVLTLFGQTFNSTNVGIAAIFIGAVLIVVVIRRALASLDIATRTEAGLMQDQISTKRKRRK